MKISELAQIHGITAGTIRHYESIGLFNESHVQRETNGYRNYSMAASKRLHLIKLGKQVGFSLKTMLTDLKHWDDDDGSMLPAHKKAILNEQLLVISHRIAELEKTRRLLIAEIEKNC